MGVIRLCVVVLESMACTRLIHASDSDVPKSTLRLDCRFPKGISIGSITSIDHDSVECLRGYRSTFWSSQTSSDTVLQTPRGVAVFKRILVRVLPGRCARSAAIGSTVQEVLIMIARFGLGACDGSPKSSGDMVPRATRSVNKDL